jgi:ATP-dependent DNA helicase RecQ
MGSKDEKVLRYGHQNLSTYGIGKDLTRKQWLLIAQQLVQKGLLEQSSDLYRTLRLTPPAYETLKTRAPILGRLEEAQPARPARSQGEIEYDTALFDLLRRKRKELADAARVAPYVIFNDKTLVEMAAYFPQSPDSLLQISGVGQVKLRNHGEAFLSVICDYCQANRIAERPKGGQRATPVDTEQAADALERSLRKPRHVEVGEAYNQGASIDSLMTAYAVQRGTVLEHLAKFSAEGGVLRPGDDFLSETAVSADLRRAALQAFEALGAERLKPVYEALEGSVTYDDLKLLRLHYLSQRR